MEIARTDSQTLVLSGLDPFVCELLRQIVPSASAEDHPAARARLFSSPTAGQEPEFDADWQAYVEPDLQEQFEASRSLVEQDLETISATAPGQPSSMRIPIAHLDSWLNALNQARLALGARHNITEGEMEREILLGDARAFALFQIDFYGSLQYYFIREIERSAE